MFIFVSSCPQMQEAEPIRSMKAKCLEKLLNISVTFSVIIFYNQKCFQKVLEELNTYDNKGGTINNHATTTGIIQDYPSHQDIQSSQVHPVWIYTWLYMVAPHSGIKELFCNHFTLEHSVGNYIAQSSMFCGPLPEVYFYGHGGHLLTPTLKLFQTKILVAMLWGPRSPICSCAGINLKLFLGKILAYSSVLAQPITLWSWSGLLHNSTWKNTLSKKTKYNYQSGENTCKGKYKSSHKKCGKPFPSSENFSEYGCVGLHLTRAQTTCFPKHLFEGIMSNSLLLDTFS